MADEKGPYPRSIPFETEAGVKLFASVFDVGELRPPRFNVVLELEPVVYLTYADGPWAGQEEITFGLSSVRSYAEGSGICGRVDYSGEDCRRLAELASRALAELAKLYDGQPPRGPRARLSDLAERLAPAA